MKTPEPPSTLILAIESATEVCSVALFDEDQLISCYEYEGQRLHAKMLAPFIDRILSDRGLNPSDLKAVAVSEGPGSYTGLRVGVSTAKGLCMSLNIPLIAVGSLQALAVHASEMARHMDALICPMIDARRMEVYCAIYDKDFGEVENIHARIIEDSSFSNHLDKRKVIFLGSGAAKCQEVFAGNANAIFLDDKWATARNFGSIAFAAYSRKDFADLVTFEPHYLKDFVATTPKKKL